MRVGGIIELQFGIFVCYSLAAAICCPLTHPPHGSLLQVSYPRVFSLTKIVEIAHFNMGRIRCGSGALLGLRETVRLALQVLAFGQTRRSPA